MASKGNGRTRKNFTDRKFRRQVEAEDRNAKWAALSPAAKLSRLEARGHGHCKQAERLRKEVEG